MERSIASLRCSLSSHSQESQQGSGQNTFKYSSNSSIIQSNHSQCPCQESTMRGGQRVTQNRCGTHTLIYLLLRKEKKNKTKQTNGKLAFIETLSFCFFFFWFASFSFFFWYFLENKQTNIPKASTLIVEPMREHKTTLYFLFLIFFKGKTQTILKHWCEGSFFWKCITCLFLNKNKKTKHKATRYTQKIHING